MILQFSLSSLKILCYVFTFQVTLVGGILMYTASTFRDMWTTSQFNLRKTLVFENDATLIAGRIIVIVTVIGLIGLMWNKSCFLTFYQVCLIGMIPILIIFGLILYSDSGSEYGRPLLKLHAIISHLDPYELDEIQDAFQCCGIEKHTDYFIFWIMWNNTGNIKEQREKQEKKENRTELKRSESSSTTNTSEVSTPPPSNSPEQELTRILQKMRNIKFGQSFSDLLSLEERKVLLPKIIATEAPGDKTTYRYITWKKMTLSEKSVDKRKCEDTSDTSDLTEKIVEVREALNRPTEINASQETVQERIVPEETLQYTSSSREKRELFPAQTYEDLRLGLFFSNAFDWSVGRPDKNIPFWWWGSGWDQLLFMNMTRNKTEHFIINLPKSCCRSPKLPCFVNSTDIYATGCRHKVEDFFWRNITEQAFILFCVVQLMFITIIAIQIYRGGLKENYYF